MANSYKNILITPNTGSSTLDPTVAFRGANSSVDTEILLKVYPTSNGTISFEGSAGQLFSITNDLTGSIYSVTDVSGIPSIEVFSTGQVRLAQYSGRILVGTATDDGNSKLQLNGNLKLTNNIHGLLVTAIDTSSTNGAIAIQQATPEGWTGIFCDYEPYTGWGLWHDNSNNFFCFTSEISTNSIRSFTVPSRVSGSRTAQEKIRLDQNNGDIWSGGSIFATTSKHTVLHAGNYTSYSPTLTGSGASGTWSINITGSASNITAYTINQSLGTGNSPTFAEVYTNGWFRNNGSGQGIYNQATGNHFYSDGAYWNAAYAGTQGLRFRNGHGGSVLGYLYAETSANFGLLNSVGSWAVQVYPSGGGNLAGGWTIGGSTPLTASNYTSYSPSLTGSGASGTWGISITGNAATVAGLSVHSGRNNQANQIVRTDGNGYIQAGWINTDSGDSGVENRLTRIYSSYDSYVRFSTLTDFKVHMGLSAKNNYSRRIDYTTDSNYWVGSMGHSGYGANEVFHGGSGFFDIWNGTNYPSGTSHIHGFNALHYTTNSLGSTGGNAYGIQVAGQYNLGGEIWSRACSGGTFSAWRRQLDDNNYSSYALPLSGGTVSGSTTFNSAVNVNGRDIRYYDIDSFKEFYVGGDANTYYPVLFGVSAWYHFARWSISRHYGDTAPWDPIGTGAHRGGLTLTWEWSGDGAWGGNDKTIRVVQFSEQYTTMVGGLALSVNGLIVWLRGGNAYYRFHGPGGTMNSATPYYSTYTASNGSTFAPRSYDTGTVASEVTNRMPVRGVAELYDGGNRVLHLGNYSSYALPLSGGTLSGLLVYSDIKWSGDQTYGLFGRNAYFDTINGRGSDPLELNYYDGGPVKIGSGTNGSKSLYAVGIYDNGNQVLHAGNYSSYAVPQTDVSTTGGGDKVLKTQSNGYLYLYNWIHVAGAGLFSGTNNAHWHPADGSYGSWKASGTRNGWNGIAFGGLSNGEVTLMVNPSSNSTGVYNPSYGWQWLWENGTAYVYKNAYGGGTQATVLDSANYSNYALPLSGGTVTGITYFLTNNAGRSGDTSSAKLQAYSTGNNSAFMSFHKSGYYAINMGLDDDNVFRIGGWSASANRFQMDMSGNLTMAGNVTAYSDERLKKDWADLPNNFVERLAEVKNGTYTRTDEDMRQVGVSAQSLKQLLPEAVLEGEYLSVAYGNAALAATVELAKRVVEQQQQIAELTALVQKLLNKE